ARNWRSTSSTRASTASSPEPSPTRWPRAVVPARVGDTLRSCRAATRTSAPSLAARPPDGSRAPQHRSPAADHGGVRKRRLRGGYRIGVSVEPLDTGIVAGRLHLPEGSPRGGVALTHGAGGNCDARILQLMCSRFADAGFLALRYDLPFRRRKPKGPP